AARSRDVAAGEAIFARAELAGDGDPTIRFAHALELSGGELAQVGVDALARAAAHGGEAGRGRYDHALFVKQPVEQALRRKHGIEQLVILHGRSEVAGAVPVFLVVILAPGRVVALAARARQLLDHQAAGPPVPNPRTFPIAAPIVPRHGQADEGRQLLGLAEIGVRGIHERLVIERDDALITLLVRAAVDGHGHVTLAEQRALVAAASGLGEPGV